MAFKRRQMNQQSISIEGFGQLFNCRISMLGIGKRQVVTITYPDKAPSDEAVQRIYDQLAIEQT